MKKVSIKDIAKMAGVSKATVSYVLNNKAEENHISKTTQEVIWAAVNKLNYRPNEIARSLSHGRTKTIGYIVPDIANPFYANIGRMIENLAYQSGFQVLVSSTDEDPDKEEELIINLLDRRIDGLILASSDESSNIIEKLVNTNFPLVLFDRIETHLNVNIIGLENRKAMKQAVNHLIKKGRKKIGLMTITPDIKTLQSRIKGYKDALEENSLTQNPEFIRTVDHKNIKKSSLHELGILINLGVDAIALTNNLIATNILWHLNNEFSHILKEIEITSFDNLEIFDFITPKVTSIAQPVNKIAQKTVEILIDNIQGNANKKRVILQPKLIVRD